MEPRSEHRTFAAERPRCDETRAARLHYQLRCLLPQRHDGDHQWTPELLGGAAGDEAATG
jgi:hypothetical protein